MLCLEEDTSIGDWVRLAALLTAALEVRVVPSTAAEHDRAVAAVSHVPHLVAAALAAHAGDRPARADARRRFVPGRHPGGREPARR